MHPESSAMELTAVFTRIQDMLLSQEHAAVAVHQLAQVAQDLIPSAAGAGVSLIDGHGARTSTGATDHLVEAADALQYELGEGPCLAVPEGATHTGGESPPDPAESHAPSRPRADAADDGYGHRR